MDSLAILPDSLHAENWWLYSKSFPTYPWNIPQTQNQQFMKEFLSIWGFGEAWGMLNGVYFWGALFERYISVGEKGLFSDESCETSGSAYENQPSPVEAGAYFQGGCCW